MFVFICNSIQGSSSSLADLQAKLAAISARTAQLQQHSQIHQHNVQSVHAKLDELPTAYSHTYIADNNSQPSLSHPSSAHQSPIKYTHKPAASSLAASIASSSVALRKMPRPLLNKCACNGPMPG